MPDRTLVWARHKITKGRALVPRSYLDPRYSDGWVEESEEEEPAGEPAPAKPKARKRAKKEKA